MNKTEHATLNAMQLLKDSERRFRALVNATSDVIYRMNPDWTIMHELDGRGFLTDTDQPIRNWRSKYIHPDDQAIVQEAIDKAIFNRSTFQLEHRVLQSDGTTGWSLSQAVPVFNEYDEITEWFGTASDITARKKMEEDLRITKEKLLASERVYEAIVGSTPDLMYVFDLNYRFIYANKALLSMWGKTYEESMGRYLIELGYEPWHAAMHEREIDQVKVTKMPVRGEVSFPHATLGRRMYDYILAPVLDEHGEVQAVAGTTRDISDLKMAEDALKQSEEQFRGLTQSLEQLIKERTQELQRSNDDLLQFAHVASHDLKEPVRKVKIFANRLEKEFGHVMPETAVLYLNKIYGATDRMNNMIEGVLNYSTVNNMEQTFSEVNLQDTLNNIETDLEVLIQQKGASIQYNAFPSFEGAPLLIYQLFYNLINNSLKFAQKEIPPVIHINSRLHSENDDSQLEITLSDNGIGFSQLYAERIFNTFTRLHSRDKYEGTGLGLALCKKIVERHNGIIRACGEEGKGSSFIVTIPLKQAHA